MKQILPAGYSARRLPGHFSFLLEETDRKNYYAIKKDWGNGLAFYRELEPGFSIALWKGFVRQPIEFHFMSATTEEDGMTALVFPVEVAAVALNTSTDTHSFASPHGKIFLINSSYEYVARLLENKPVEILEIFIKNDWIRDQYAHDDTGMCDVCSELARNKTIRTETTGSLLYFHTITSGIIGDIEEGQGNGLQLKFRALELLDFALHQFHPEMPRQNEMRDFSVRIKQIISRHLDGKLPAIAELALEMATSESSLKRKFKKSFGTSIYEYYTARKMELAKTMISDNGLQVTEVAYKLSYEKVSHFIEVFKKFYGESPGKFKRSDAERT